MSSKHINPESAAVALPCVPFKISIESYWWHIPALLLTLILDSNGLGNGYTIPDRRQVTIDSSFVPIHCANSRNELLLNHSSVAAHFDSPQSNYNSLSSPNHHVPPNADFYKLAEPIVDRYLRDKSTSIVTELVKLFCNDQVVSSFVSLSFTKFNSEFGRYSTQIAELCRLVYFQLSNGSAISSPKCPVDASIVIAYQRYSNILLEELLKKAQHEFTRWVSYGTRSDIYSINGQHSPAGVDSGHNSPSNTMFNQPIPADRKPKLLNAVKFIGETGRLDLLPEAFLFDCLRTLLARSRSTPVALFQENLEAACQLLKIVGKKLDHPLARALMDQYFGRIHQILTSTSQLPIEKRIRFLLSDLVQLRHSGWGTSDHSSGESESSPEVTKLASSSSSFNHTAPSPSTSPSTTSSSSGFVAGMPPMIPPFFMPTPPASGGTNQQLNGGKFLPTPPPYFFFPPPPFPVPMSGPVPNAEGGGLRPPLRGQIFPPGSAFMFPPPPLGEYGTRFPPPAPHGHQPNGLPAKPSSLQPPKLEICPSYVAPKSDKAKIAAFPYDPSSIAAASAAQLQPTPRTFATVSSGQALGAVEMTKIGVAKKSTATGKSGVSKIEHSKQPASTDQPIVSLRPQGGFGKQRGLLKKEDEKSSHVEAEKDDTKSSSPPDAAPGQKETKKPLISHELLAKLDQQVIKASFASFHDLIQFLEREFSFSQRPVEIAFHILVASLEQNDEHKEQCQMILAHYRNQGILSQSQMDGIFSELVSSIPEFEAFSSCVKSNVASHLAIAISGGLQSIACLPLSGRQHPVALIAVQRAVKRRSVEQVFKLFDNSRAVTSIVQSDILRLLPEALRNDAKACRQTLEDRSLGFFLFDFELPLDLANCFAEKPPASMESLAQQYAAFARSLNLEQWQFESRSFVRYMVLSCLKKHWLQAEISQWSLQDFQRLVESLQTEMNWTASNMVTELELCLVEASDEALQGSKQ